MNSIIRSKINRYCHARAMHFEAATKTAMMQKAQVMLDEGADNDHVITMLGIDNPDFQHEHKTTAQISDEKITRICDLIGGEL